MPPPPAMKLAMSRPEQKLLPSPCSTTARTEASPASCSAAFIKPSNMAWSSALCLSARTIVTVATPLAPIRTRTLSSLTGGNLSRPKTIRDPAGNPEPWVGSTDSIVPTQHHDGSGRVESRRQAWRDRSSSCAPCMRRFDPKTSGSERARRPENKARSLARKTP